MKWSDFSTYSSENLVCDGVWSSEVTLLWQYERGRGSCSSQLKTQRVSGIHLLLIGWNNCVLFSDWLTERWCEIPVGQGWSRSRRHPVWWHGSWEDCSGKYSLLIGRYKYYWLPIGCSGDRTDVSSLSENWNWAGPETDYRDEAGSGITSSDWFLPYNTLFWLADRCSGESDSLADCLSRVCDGKLGGGAGQVGNLQVNTHVWLVETISY